MRLEVHPVDLATVAEAALDTLRPAAGAKQIALAAALERGGPVIAGDADRLQQVVWNLLSNAVKFTPGGGRVDVGLRTAGDHLVLSVRDTGPGIPEAALPHIFERFHQADASSTRRYGGLGLGLAIVRHLVELHGGTVEAANVPGGGALFEVRLPVLRDPVPAVVATPRDATRRERRSSLSGVRVLLVEDHPDARELVTTVLEGAGARVTAVGTAAEALGAIERELPDVLVSDLEMPGQDGYELVRQIRARPPQLGGELPAAALTAYADGEHRARALAAGFQAHVAKPVHPDMLLDVVLRLARRR
jgi:CheY-like chemotaxis protein